MNSRLIRQSELLSFSQNEYCKANEKIKEKKIKNLSLPFCQLIFNADE